MKVFCKKHINGCNWHYIIFYIRNAYKHYGWELSSGYLNRLCVFYGIKNSVTRFRGGVNFGGWGR